MRMGSRLASANASAFGSALGPAVGLAMLLAACPNTPTSEDDTAVSEDVVGVDGAADVAGDTQVELPEAGCTEDAACAPDGPLPTCRVARCVAGECVLADADDGAACDDGDACSTGDTCTAGVCAGVGGQDCDDGNPCTTDACDPSDGCVSTFNQKPCDDGSACTVEDACLLGACVGDALGCDDGNPCTDDSCDAAAGCTWTDNTAPCSDLDACTVGDVCAEGACVPGDPAECGAGNPCVDAACDPLTGCSSVPLSGPCDDSDACTDGDQCIEGLCTGTLVVCDDANPCTSDYCSPVDGCQFIDNTAACDDGDSCTLKDACADGACVPGPIDPLCCDDDAGCDDGDPCTTDACTLGYCGFTSITCDDGHACTADACVEGVCDNVPYGPLPSGPVLTEGFEAEGALPGWSVETDNAEVTWQADDKEVHSGEWSLYCGNVPDYTYDKGVTLASARRKISLPPGDASLSFWIQQDVDESSCTYDVTSVWIDGVALDPSLCLPIAAWEQQVYDVTPWAGQTVELELRFATTDGVANSGMGVWIDDLEVIADSPAGCCLVTGDCSGAGCLAETCGEESFACEAPAEADACDDLDVCTADSCGDDGMCAYEPLAGCCTDAGECPADEAAPCAVPTCEANACGLDTSACP